jgi:hypothetical protein
MEQAVLTTALCNLMDALDAIDDTAKYEIRPEEKDRFLHFLVKSFFERLNYSAMSLPHVFGGGWLILDAGMTNGTENLRHNEEFPDPHDPDDDDDDDGRAANRWNNRSPQRSA